jgi:hypothetical protein
MVFGLSIVKDDMADPSKPRAAVAPRGIVSNMQPGRLSSAASQANARPVQQTLAQLPPGPFPGAVERSGAEPGIQRPKLPRSGAMLFSLG